MSEVRMRISKSAAYPWAKMMWAAIAGQAAALILGLMLRVSFSDIIALLGFFVFYCIGRQAQTHALGIRNIEFAYNRRKP